MRSTRLLAGLAVALASALAPATALAHAELESTDPPADATLEQPPAEVALVFTSEVDGVFHIHGYDEQVPATTVTAGERIELRFEATRSGQFPIELHLPGESEGVDVGILTVHEP